MTYEQPFFISINVSGEISPSGLIMTHNVYNLLDIKLLRRIYLHT